MTQAVKRIFLAMTVLVTLNNIALAQKTPISIQQVEPMVRDFAFHQTPDLKQPVKFAISEFQVPGLWENLHIQIVHAGYLTKNNEQFRDTLFVIHNSKLIPFASTFGGYGLLSATVFKNRMYFSFSWGSGIHRSQIGIMQISDNTVQTKYSEGNANVDLFVKSKNGIIQVEHGKFLQFNSWSDSKQFGFIKGNDTDIVIIDNNGTTIPFFNNK